MSSDIHADARGDIHLVGVQGIHHSAAGHCRPHPRDYPEGAPIVCAFQEATLLDADNTVCLCPVHGQMDVFGVCHGGVVRWQRHRDISTVRRARQFVLLRPKIIAEHTHAPAPFTKKHADSGQSGQRQGRDVALRLILSLAASRCGRHHRWRRSRRGR